MTEQIYLTASQVCRRYGGISDMTLWRWSHDAQLGFPKPTYIGRRRFWPLAALDAFDVQKAPAESEAA